MDIDRRADQALLVEIKRTGNKVIARKEIVGRSRKIVGLDWIQKIFCWAEEGLWLSKSQGGIDISGMWSS